MADLDSVRFPPKISRGAVGGPRFKTTVSVMASGAESRNQEWELERGEWVVGFNAREQAQFAPLLSFFRIVAGMANTFRFKDWTDYICLTGEGFFVESGFGSPTVLQMVKRYTFGAYSYDRYITKPISGKVTTDAVGLDYSTGQATSGTTWHGEFDCCVRLNSDPMRNRVIDRNQGGLIMAWDDIELVETNLEQR